MASGITAFPYKSSECRSHGIKAAVAQKALLLPAKISISHPYLLVQGIQAGQVFLLIQDHLYFLFGQFLQSYLLVHFLLCFLVEQVFQAAPVVLDSLFRGYTDCNLFILNTWAQRKATQLSNCIPSGSISLI